ncbi:MAG: hypothetical protein S4CHLAM102_07720 [Chlamydiia bacterium]|nr:hypothetical protein [Chlamydiia bacterium]
MFGRSEKNLEVMCIVLLKFRLLNMEDDMKFWLSGLIWLLALPLVAEGVDFTRSIGFTQYKEETNSPIEWKLHRVESPEQAQGIFSKEQLETVLDTMIIVSSEVTNVPKDSAYDLYLQQLTGTHLAYSFIEKDGTLVLKDRPDVNISGCLKVLGNYAKGEYFRFHLVNKQDQTRLTREICPDPFNSESNGKYLNIETRDPVHSFILTGGGFQPKEKLAVTSYSGIEQFTFEVEADADGMIVMGLSPEVQGMMGSPAKISVRDQKNDTIELKYAWGTELLRISKK